MDNVRMIQLIEYLQEYFADEPEMSRDLEALRLKVERLMDDCNRKL
jgi:hypothetical protein